MEAYSVNVPGTSSGRKSASRSACNDCQAHRAQLVSESPNKKWRQSHSGEPGSDLRPYMLINDTVSPGPSGFQATRTVRPRDLNGNFGMVEVDTTKSDKVPTIQVQQTPAEKP